MADNSSSNTKSDFHRLVSAINENNLENMKEKISSLNLSEAEQFESFCLAASEDRTEIVKLMLLNGFEFLNKDTGECPAFQSAAFNNNIEIIQILLEKGVGICQSVEKAVLYLATCQDNPTVIKILSDRGVDIYGDVKGPYSCVHIAVEEECLSVLEFFLTNGVDVNTRYPGYGDLERGEFLLHRAVLKGSEALVELLFCFNADVNIKNTNGATPLHIAAEKGFYKIADSLVARANINELTTPEPRTDYYLGKFNETEAIRFFLNLKPPSFPDVVMKSDAACAPLHVAVMNGHENIVRLLLEHNANVDLEDSNGDSVLNIAVERGNLAIIDLILTYSPNLNEGSNKVALTFAMQNDGVIHKKIVNKLLDYGFMVDSEDVDLYEMLFDAVHNNHLKIVDHLLNGSADVNMNYSEEKDDDGKCKYVEPTLLHLAVRNDNKDMIELLLNYGANINAKPGDASSPILYSLMNRNSEIFKFLLSKGACVLDDAHILITAVEMYLLEIVRDLLLMGADVNRSVSFDKESFNYSVYERFQPPPNPVSYMKSALFVAAENGLEKVVKLLIENGAEMNFETFYGISPLLVAVIKGHFKTVDLLLKLGASHNPFVCSDSSGKTALHLAAEIGHKDIVSLLIRHGAKVDCCATIMTRETPLFFSCREGHFEVVDILLKFGANICAVDSQGRTPLFITASHGLHEMVKFLVDRGGISEFYDVRDGLTPLLISAAEGHLKCVDVLLECGANIHRTNFNVETALHFAAKNGHADIVKLLLKHGAIINAESIQLETPLSLAAKEDRRDIVEILLKSGANPNAGNCRPLYFAALNGQHEIAKILLKYGARADPTGQFCDGDNPMTAAADKNHIDIVETLLKAGVNNCQCSQACDTAAFEKHHKIVELLVDNGASLEPEPFFLTYAEKGNTKVIQALLQSGTNVDFTDRHGETALHRTAELGHLDLVKLLLDKGAKVDAKTTIHNNTPLHCSAAKGHLKIAEVLLQKNAYIDSVNCYDRTALFVAAEHGQIEMVKFLLESGATVDLAENETSRTPLLAAAERGHFDIVKVLLQCGARADVKDVDGFTAFYFAVEFGHEKTVELLLQKGVDIDCQTRNDLPLILVAAERGYLPTLEVLLKYGVNTNVFKLPTEKIPLKTYYREKIPEWKPQVFQCILDFSYIAKGYGCADSTDESDRLRLSKFNIPSFFKIFSNLQPVYENDPHLTLSNYYNLGIRLIYHTVKMRAANLYSTEGNLFLTILSAENQISEYQVKCVAEVEKMKSEYIGCMGNTDVSLYNILTASLHQLARYAKNPDIVEYFSSISQDLNVNFPIYCKLIKGQFQKGKIGRELQDKVTKILYHSSLSEILPSQGLQEICIENILNYLNIKDLRNVILALPS